MPRQGHFTRLSKGSGVFVPPVAPFHLFPVEQRLPTPYLRFQAGAFGCATEVSRIGILNLIRAVFLAGDDLACRDSLVQFLTPDHQACRVSIPAEERMI